MTTAFPKVLLLLKMCCATLQFLKCNCNVESFNQSVGFLTGRMGQGYHQYVSKLLPHRYEICKHLYFT
jgi:hypothetical protein